MARKVPPFTLAELEQLARVLADTRRGLTGSQLGRLIREFKLVELDPDITRWKRLFNALGHYQERTQSGSKVLSFIKSALDPVRYRGQQARFEELRDGVNVTLAFRGLEFRDGKFHKVRTAENLARQRRWRIVSALPWRDGAFIQMYWPIAARSFYRTTPFTLFLKLPRALLISFGRGRA